jgi:hypothetical protein
MTEQIAKIRRADIGVEDHGILTVFLDFDYGGSGQGLPGYALDEPVRDENDQSLGRFGTAYGMEFVKRVMAAAGVDRWSEVEGRTVLVLREEGYHGQIVGFKPLPTERGKEFIVAEMKEQMLDLGLIPASWA